VQLVLPPTDEAPYYLRKGAGDIVSGPKGGTNADTKKQPATKAESDEEDEDSD